MQAEDRDLERGEGTGETGPPVEDARDGQQAATIEHTRTAIAIFQQRPHWARSEWRFPTNRGDVPRYMQRAFRWKTFGLMTLQLFMVLLIAVPLRQMKLVERIPCPSDMENVFRQGILYFLGILNLSCLLLLHCYKDRFPANYVFLACTTVTSGIFWSAAYSKSFMTVLQFEILGILFFTMVFATVISSLMSRMERKWTGSQVLFISFIPSWVVASSAMVVWYYLLSERDSLEMIGAVGVSAILLGILFLDVGSLLLRCDPDDFMRVIVSMNSTMLVVVSIPFFFLAFCMLRMDHQQEELQLPDLPAPELQRATEGASHAAGRRDFAAY